MNTDILKEVILEQKQYFEEETEDEEEIPRDALVDIIETIDIPHVVVISGLRRSGKSTLLRQIRNKFYKKKVVYYFNFEDERLIKMTNEDMNDLYEAFLELYGESKVFFLDEVQNVDGWEMFVRRLYDQKFKFFITGSNASMLSRELGSRLTGRYVSVEVFPFSFKEFLRFNKMEIPEVLTTKDRAAVKKAYRDYFERGGMPEFLRYDRMGIIQTLYENILYKDILVRYGLQDERVMKELAMYLISNCSSEITYNQLKKMLNVGSVNTIKSYIDHLESSYLIFTLNKYSPSLKKQLYSHKKTYVIDVSFIDLVSFKFAEDYGRVMENIVLVELKRSGKDVYFHQEKKECDFVIREKRKIKEAIQVTYRLTNKNRDREIKGLLEAMEEYGLKKGLIITDNERSAIEENGYSIEIIPIWDWLRE